LVAAGAAAGWQQATSLWGVFALTGSVALAAALLARRLPDRPLAGITEERPAPAPTPEQAERGEPARRPPRVS
ncbi:MAG TPA: hypothetical protein VGC06_10400, partial [Actinomycetes bacterium]